MINASLFDDFLHLVQSRNFSTTARTRGMSQSTLSRRIAQLEDYVGAALFDRSIQPVALTPAGVELLPRAHAMAELMQEVRSIGRPDAHSSAAQCSMIALSTLAMNFFPGWLSRHDSEGETWQVKLWNTEPLLASNIKIFLSGQSEFLLTFACDQVSDLYALRHHRYIVLGQDKAKPVTIPRPDGSPLWSLDREGPVSHCAYTGGSFFYQALAGQMRRLGPKLVTVRDNSMAAVLHSMIRQGHGMGWLPGLQIGDELATGQLVRAGGTDYDVDVEIRLYRSHSMSRYAQSFWASVSAGQKIRRKELRVA